MCMVMTKHVKELQSGSRVCSLWGQTQNLLAGLLVWLCTWDSLIVYSYTLHIFKYCYIDINKIKLNGIKFDSTDSVCGCAPSKCLSVFLSLLV